MAKDFFSAVEQRRSIYGLSDEQVISNERIAEIVRQSIKHAPSAFNSQSARTVILFGEQHKKLWHITKEILRKLVPAESFAPTEERINSFYASAGTILFFEDQSVVEGLQKQFSLYADKFPLWSLQSSGMAQFIVWTALENEGLGASIQHYDPLIDEDVRKEWGVPTNWKLLTELVFGKPIVPPAEKTFQSIDERVKIFG